MTKKAKIIYGDVDDVDEDSILLSGVDFCVLYNDDAFDADGNIKITHFTTAAVRHAIEYLNGECRRPAHIDELSPAEASQLKLYRRHTNLGDTCYELDDVNSLYRYYKYQGILYRYYKHRRNCPDCMKEIVEEIEKEIENGLQRM